MIKTIVNRLSISGSLVLITCFCLFGQNQPTQNASPEWVGAYLNVAGASQIDGVELSAQPSKCGNADVVLLKFTNHNSYSVQIEWADAIYTTERTWKHNESQTKEKIITVKGGEEKVGTCESTKNGSELLVIEVHALIDSNEEYYRFAPSYFVVTNTGK